MTRPLLLADWHIDLSTGAARGPRGQVGLTAMECALLAHLAGRRGQVVSRQELLTEVWGYAPGTRTRTLTSTIERVRRKLEPEPASPRWLRTVRGRGYRLEPAPDPNAPAAPAAPAAPFPPHSSGHAAGPSSAHAAGPSSAHAIGPSSPAGSGGRSSLPGAGFTYAHQPRWPRPLTPLIGRRAELSRLATLHGAGRRLITILGTGGVGKTRLATAAGPRLGLPRRWFVDLAAAHDRPALLHRIAQAVGLPSSRGRQDRVALLSRFFARQGPALLVLDNFEQLLGPDDTGPTDHPSDTTDSDCALPLARWLADAPHLCVLVTSRQPLSLYGEALLPIEPLPREEALALFQARRRDAGHTGHGPSDQAAAAGRSEQTPTPDDSARLARLLDRLDRLPLAIELAAQARSRSLDELERTLEAHGLRSHQRDRGARQRSLAASIGWSLQLLSPAARAAFPLLGLFHGHIPAGLFQTLAALRSDAGAGSASTTPARPPPTDDALHELAAASLLRVGAGPGSFAMLETVRAEAARMLDRDPARALRQHRALARLWWQEAERQGVRGVGPQPIAALRWLQQQRDNLAACWRRRAGLAPIEAARVGLLLGSALLGGGPLESCLAVLAEALRTPEPLPAELHTLLLLLQADALGLTEGARAASETLRRARPRRAELSAPLAGRLAADLAYVLLLDGQRDEAAPLFEEALAPALPAEVRAWALCGQARLRGSAHARPLLEQAWSLLPQLGPVATPWEARIGSLLATLVRRTDPDRARQMLERAVSISRTRGDHAVEARALNRLGVLFLELGDHARAEREFHATHQLQQQIGVVDASALSNLAAIRHQDGDTDQARLLYLEAIEILERTAMRRELTLTHANLAGLEQEAGCFDEAEALATMALEGAQELASVWLAGLAHGTLGAVARERGQHDRAATHLERALALMDEAGDLRFRAFQRGQIATLAHLRGDLEAADRGYRQALQTIDTQGDRHVGALLRMRCAALAAARGQRGRAERLLDEAAPHLSGRARAAHTLHRQQLRLPDPGQPRDRRVEAALRQRIAHARKDRPTDEIRLALSLLELRLAGPYPFGASATISASTTKDR